MANEGKGIWCIAETRHGKLAPSVFELVTAAKKISAARAEPVTVVVLGGSGIAAEAEQAAVCGADKVLVVENESLKNFVDDAYASALNALVAAERPRTLLLPASVFGRSLAPRLAVANGGALAAAAIDFSVEGGRLRVRRSAYAGNVIETVELKSGLEVVTCQALAFDRAAKNSPKCPVASAPAAVGEGKTQFVSFAADQSGEVDLGGAEKIVSGGRGLGNAEGFAAIRSLAKALGAAVGASRAAVDSGWIEYKHQVGLTGRAVRPRLYVACGISGQIQHLAGMKASDVIVAINTDADCPMMKMATYAVQGDLFKIIPAVVSEIQSMRGHQNGA